MIRTRLRGFTIVELLTILAILGILAALLIPQLTRSRMKAFHSACIQNVHNIGTACQTYANDYGGRYPTALDVLLQGGTPVLKALPTCPSDDSSYQTLYRVNNSDGHYTIACNGIHWQQLGDVEQGYPQFYATGRLDADGNP